MGSENPLKKLVFAFLAWRILLIILIIIAPAFFIVRPRFLAADVQEFVKHPLLWSHASYDGDYYLKIASNNYSYQEKAFFPFFPFLMTSVSGFLSIPLVWAGLIISHASFLLAIIFFYRLFSLDYPDQTVLLAVLLLLIFPVSFYFGSVYSESTFLLLAVLSFYLARKKYWLAACLVGVIATATKFEGIFLLPALFIEKYIQIKETHGSKPFTSQLLSLIPLLIIPTGLIYFMYFLNEPVSDPLSFIKNPSSYGQFSSERIIMLYQVFWRYLKMLATVNRSDPLFYTVLLEGITGIFFLLTSLAAFKLHRLSLAVFNFLCYIVPTFTGSFVSLPRYVLACFPSFIVLALYLSRHPLQKIAYFSLSALGLFYFWMKFSQGYWVG